MDFGSLLQFLLLMWNVYNGAKGFAGLALTYNQGLAAADRLLEVFSLQPTVREAPHALSLPVVSGELEFRNVSFSYDGVTEVVRDVSFHLQPGEQVAFVGPSGSGKTTIIALAARLYDPSSGSVLLDGNDLRRLKFSSLRRAIAIVPQDALLFSGTIYDNILFGRGGYSPDDVEQAAALANASDFISSLPHGYQTEVGERGSLLSGGQRQRIAIARALLAKPKLLLLDEATSALDPASEQAIRATLETLRHHVTTLIIAHQLTTVRQADRILVLQDGHIVEEGSHGQLLAAGGAYAKLVAGAELTSA
jgi:ABC-type multidrug transport system fused ATPase/permease subunit